MKLPFTDFQPEKVINLKWYKICQRNSNFPYVLFPEEHKISSFLSFVVNVKDALKCMSMPTERRFYIYFELFVLHVKSLEKSRSPFVTIRLQGIVNKLQ